MALRSAYLLRHSPSVRWHVDVHVRGLVWRFLAIFIVSIATDTSADQTVSSDAITLADVRAILAPKTVDVDILGDKPVPGDIQRIHLTMRQSAANHRDWLLETLKTLGPGEQLPYHPNLGISESDYNKFLDYMENLAMVPIAQGRLRFVQQSESQIRIINVAKLPELDSIVVDFENNRIVTPWGIANKSDLVLASESQKATGPFDAIAWRSEDESPSTGTYRSITLNVGRQTKSPDNLIYLRVTIADKGQLTHKYRTVIRFPK